MVYKRKLPVLVTFPAILLLFLSTINNGFFWDTIQLASKHANYYLTTDFTGILLPDSIDSGHIPAFGIYLAFIWKIFGRSLIISHLAMLPFVVGILWQMKILVSRFVSKENTGWAFLLVCCDPTLLSQVTLVSPDVPLVFFFLLGLNSLLGNRKSAFSLSILFLFLTSMRGMMVSLSFLIIDIIRNIKFSKPVKEVVGSLLKRSLIYLPAFILFISFSAYHLMQKGWIGFHDNSPWAELFERVGFKGLIFNIGILGWRLIDFGRIGIWIVFIILMIRQRGRVFKDADTRLLFLIFIILLLILSVNMLWARNLLAHRYLLPVYISFSLLCAHILFTYKINEKLKIMLISFWLMALMTGNLWVYPEKTAQGWDSTLAHLPYYKIRKQAIDYLDRQEIDFNEVQSFFPNNSKIDYVDLNGDNRQFADFDNSGKYVIYSNVFNISDEDYDLIRKSYPVIKQFKRGLLYIYICKRK